MQARIDYLKFRFSGTWDTGHARVERANEIIRLYEKENGLLKNVPFKTWYVRSDKNGEDYVFWFEVWGPVAEFVADYTPIAWWRVCNRLDWRVDCGSETQFSVGEVEQAARAVNGNNITISRVTSANRSKRGGRDAGGNSVAVGSRKSAARACYYKRNRENTALECQFQNDGARLLIARAIELWEQQEEDTLNNIVREEAHKRSQDLVGRYFGLALEMLEGSTPRPSQLTFFARQENLLEWIEEQCQALEPDARKALGHTLLGIEPEYEVADDKSGRWAVSAYDLHDTAPNDWKEAEEWDKMTDGEKEAAREAYDQECKEEYSDWHAVERIEDPIALEDHTPADTRSAADIYLDVWFGEDIDKEADQDQVQDWLSTSPNIAAEYFKRKMERLEGQLESIADTFYDQ